MHHADVEEQLEECESLLCIFEGDQGKLSVDVDALSELTEWARTTTAAQGSSCDAARPPAALAYTVKIQPEDGCNSDSETGREQGDEAPVSAELAIPLPPDYPSASPPHLIVRCAAHPKVVEDALQDHLQTLAKEEYVGECCLFQLIEAAPAALATVLGTLRAEGKIGGDRDKDAASAATLAHGSLSNSSIGSEAVFMRQFIYFHHIYNKSKRRDILSHGLPCCKSVCVQVCVYVCVQVCATAKKRHDAAALFIPCTFTH